MYSAKDDESLSLLAQSGDKEAANALVSRYWKVAVSVGRAFPVRGYDKEDIEAIALEGLARAVQSFAEDRGTKFGTYARRVMTRAIVDLWRSADRLKEIPAERLANLNDVIGLDGGDEVTLEDAIATPGNPEADIVERLEAHRRVAEALEATWPPFRDVMNGFGHEAVASRNKLDAYAVVAIIEAVQAVCRNSVDPDLYGNLRSLILDDGVQPALFGPVRGTNDAGEIAFAVFTVFRQVRNAVIGDLVAGHSYAAIAERNDMPIEAVSKLLEAVRAVAVHGANEKVA